MCFYEIYEKLCALKGVSPSAAALDIGLSKAAVNGWKDKKSKPQNMNLIKICNYFNVDPKSLLSGEIVYLDEIKKTLPDSSELTEEQIIKLLKKIFPADELEILEKLRRANARDKALVAAILSVYSEPETSNSKEDLIEKDA